MGWVGSNALKEAMIDSPCGCDLVQLGRETADKRIAKAYESDGVTWQKAWGCPRTCEGTKKPLGESQKDVLEQVKRLTDAEGFETCPLYALRLDWIGDVVRARRWFSKGQLNQRVLFPPMVLVDAIDLIEDSVNARDQYELRLIQEANRSAATSRPGNLGKPRK